MEGKGVLGACIALSKIDFYAFVSVTLLIAAVVLSKNLINLP